MLKILFVCTGNTCRSPMAEALMKAELGVKRPPFRVVVSSAGLSALPGGKVSGQAVNVLGTECPDLNKHTARPLDCDLIDDSDIILVMTEDHKRQLKARFPRSAGKTFLLKEFAGLDRDGRDIEDPAGYGPEIYRRVLEEIRACVKKITAKLKEEQQDENSPGK